MDVMVTGGAGFIGSHVCRALGADAGRVGRVLVLDDLSTGVASNLPGLAAIELIEGSILDDRLVDELVGSVDAVVHLAAVPAVARSLKDPRRSHDVNVTGTMVVLESARRHGRHVIVASSSSVYGRGAVLPTAEDHPTRPASPYAASKLAAESYALAYGSSFGLPVLVLRFFNVYGPLQRADHAYAAVIPAFVDAALRQTPLRIDGDGLQTRDFTFVADVTAVIEDALMRSLTADRAVNLAFGSRTSLLEVVGELEELLGRRIPRVHGPPRPGDVHDSQADGTRLRSLFPSVSPTPLRDGLRSTVDWFAAEEEVSGDPKSERGARASAAVRA
jgi:UDP-glucose 4-epimerase